jgi:hypothetical protein
MYPVTLEPGLPVEGERTNHRESGGRCNPLSIDETFCLEQAAIFQPELSRCYSCLVDCKATLPTLAAVDIFDNSAMDNILEVFRIEPLRTSLVVESNMLE